MATILDEAGAAIEDEAGGFIYDEAGAPPVIVFSASVARLRWTVLRARNSQGAGMTLTMAVTSTDDVQVLIQGLVNGVASDPTSYPVAMAWVAMPQYGAPAAPSVSSGSWNTAVWETDSSGGAAQYWSSCLVGGQNGGVVLTAGAWQTFVKITTSGSVPILPGPVLLLS